jgi:hypothetical protein
MGPSNENPPAGDRSVAGAQSVVADLQQLIVVLETRLAALDEDHPSLVRFGAAKETAELTLELANYLVTILTAKAADQGS